MNPVPPPSARRVRLPTARLLTALAGLAIGAGTAALGVVLLKITPDRVLNLALVSLGAAQAAGALATLLSDRAWRVLEVGACRLGIRTGQLLLLGVGAALSFAARSAAGDGAIAHLPGHGLLWAAGIACVVAGCWSTAAGVPKSSLHRGEALGIVGLVVVALAVRAIDLDGIPPILGGDEGALGLTARQFLTGERSNILAMGWFSWPAMHPWIVSWAQRILGPTAAAIRWPSAAAGTLTVLATFWMARKLFGVRAGWFSAATLSVSHVHLLFSRVAMNNIFDGLLLATAVGALWVAWESDRRWAFLVAGLTVGLSPYFYATARVLPLLLLAWMFTLRRIAPWRSRAAGLVAMALTAAAAALPLVGFYAAHPDEWLAPLSRVSSFNAAWLQANGLGQTPTAGLMLREFSNTLLGLVARPLLGVYYPGIPYFDPLSSAFFLLGLALALRRVDRPQHAIIPIILLTLGLTGAFSLGAPASQRLVFAAPILAACIGLSADSAIQWARSRNPRLRTPVSVVAAVALVATCLYQAGFFFGKAMPLARYSDVQALVATELGRYLRRYPEGTPLYFIDAESVEAAAFPSLAYLAPHIQTRTLEWPSVMLPEPSTASGPTLWVTFPEQAAILSELQATYPQARSLRWVDASGRPLFGLLEVRGTGKLSPDDASPTSRAPLGTG